MAWRNNDVMQNCWGKIEAAFHSALSEILEQRLVGIAAWELSKHSEG